jgi:hypothetical protein
MSEENYSWLEGLSTRAGNCVRQIGWLNHLEFEGKEDFKKWVREKGPEHLRKYRNLGKKSYHEILDWLEIPYHGEPMIFCPCCRRTISRRELYQAIFTHP